MMEINRCKSRPAVIRPVFDRLDERERGRVVGIVDDMARMLQVVQDPGKRQYKRGVKDPTRPKMLQREIHAADPVGFLLQMIERPHQNT